MTSTFSANLEHWPLDRLIPHARNAQTHSEDQVGQIAGSIAEFGFVNPDIGRRRWRDRCGPWTRCLRTALHSRVNFRPSMTRGGSECSDFVEIAECNGSYQEVYSRSGLPLAIRSDNGVPFASPTGLFNLSKLSVWWLRLGIAIERNGLLVFGPVIVHHALNGLIDLVEDEGAG